MLVPVTVMYSQFPNQYLELKRRFVPAYLCNSAKKFVDEYRSLFAFLALAFPLLALQAQRPTAPNGVPAVRTVDYEATAVSSNFPNFIGKPS
jgi:hypothetical protein